MGCGLSRFWKAARPRNAAVSDEEVTPLLLPAKEKPPDRPDPSAQEGPPPDLHPVLGHGFRVKFVCFVCALFGAAIGFAILLREPLKLQIGKDSAVPHCFIGQMFKNIHWMIIACGQHWMQLLLICMLVPALYVFKTCSTRVADCLVLRFARQEHVERFVAKAEVALMVLLWLADMLSDMYVAYTYCKQKLYVFAFLMILIWLGSGCLAFSHRYVSWERCDSETNLGYFAQGLNEHGEPKPGYKTFLLYILQVQPLIMALNSWQHGMTRRLQEEKMVAALTEAAPSSLLQLYALLLDPPKENSLDLQLLWGSIALSILTVAMGINKAYELCVPESCKMEKHVLPAGVLVWFRWCDTFSRIGVWALLGICLRPIGAKRHGIQQPYLPVILAAELLLIAMVFKSRSFGLNLAWSQFLKKENFVGVISGFLSVYWCCNTADLVVQHKLFRSLLGLRLLQTLGILWLCTLIYSASVGSHCLVAEQPAVVIVALLVLLTFALTFFTALVHDVAMSFFALPFFPVIAGNRGGRLELAARFGVASQIPRLLRSATKNEGVAVLCQAAEAGQVAAIHALVGAGIPPAAEWNGATALHWAAGGGHISAIQALQLRGGTELGRADKSLCAPVFYAAGSGHLEMVRFLHHSGCSLEGSLEGSAEHQSRPAVVNAAACGHLNVVQFLRDSGCSMETFDCDGITPLASAAANGHLEIVRFLHDSGCSMETPDLDGWTAAILAAQNGHADVVKFLHESACNLATANNTGCTPMTQAAQNGHLDVVKYLHCVRCSLETPSKNAVKAAAQNGHVEVLMFFLQSGCLEKASKSEANAILQAAHFGRLDVLKSLHKSGCSLEKAKDDGVAVAVENGDVEMVRFFHTSGCDIGVHSLHVAVAEGHLKVVEFLLGVVDVNAAGIGHVHALDIARANDPNSPVTEALLRAGASPGPEPQLVGLTALKPSKAPPHGNIWFTCGTPKLARSRGKFYHEIQILSEFDCPQLGWLSTDFDGGDDDDGKGVGDDANGWAFDGQRCCWWHGSASEPLQIASEPLQIAQWNVTEVLGFAADLDKGWMQLRTDNEQQDVFMRFEANGAVYLVKV